MKYYAEIKVTLKDGIKDPQGLAAETVLKRTGINETASIRAGKFFEIEIEAATKEEALKDLQPICEEVLSNPCLEKFEILKVEQV